MINKMAGSFHKEGVWVHKTSLTPSLLIEVPLPSQESDQSCICELGVRGHVFVS